MKNISKYGELGYISHSISRPNECHSTQLPGNAELPCLIFNVIVYSLQSIYIFIDYERIMNRRKRIDNGLAALSFELSTWNEIFHFIAICEMLSNYLFSFLTNYFHWNVFEEWIYHFLICSVSFCSFLFSNAIIVSNAWRAPRKDCEKETNIFITDYNGRMWVLFRTFSTG